ncbi:leucine--tRNA ligase [Bacteroidota bacterium]
MAEEKFNKFAKKWQKAWDKSKIFVTKDNSKKKKFYCLEMYPYPSGKLHMGHVRNYSIGDAFARYKRMQGFNVLYPMGYDSFGLPAENAAIKNKKDPEVWTNKNVKTMKEQQKQLGLSYDWNREVMSHDSNYFKWNQWVFLKLLEENLAYKKKSLVNWCPKCNTVLANEQVKDGKCWRHENTDVEQHELEQWYYKVKEYADELLDCLDDLDWPDRVKIMQKNWIGKSEGTDIYFPLEGFDIVLPTFTTRCDTIYSVTFIVMAPEHPMVKELVKGTKYEKETLKVIKKIQSQTEIERTTPEGKDKIGCFLGKYAINPVNGKKIPIYIANFVMMYGTGIVMADAHDQRDFEFARKYNIPLKFVISEDGYPIDPKKASRAYLDDGTLFDSGDFSGMHNRDALPMIADWLEEQGWGKKTFNYKLRDWLISRQRYWGTPIPIIYCKKCGIVPVPEKDLPVKLPKDVKFSGKGNPLETSKSFVSTKCPKCKGKAKRETDTMDTFVDSSWYFMRYCDPKNKNRIFDAKKLNYWLPVDQYIGGIEHAIMHLLYARFYTKATRDLGLHKVNEPFQRLLCQGMVLKDGTKMSKSIGNTVDPGEIISKFGPDTARMFMLFTALPEKELEWSDKGVAGNYKFLKRVYSLADTKFKVRKEKNNKDKHLISKLHSTIKIVTEYMEEFKLSLAIGKIMELVSTINSYADEGVHKETFNKAMESLILLLTPFVPHIAEEMWEKLGKKPFASTEKWPSYDGKKIDRKAETREELIHNTVSDAHKIKELRNEEKVEKIIVYTPDPWKYNFINLFKEKFEKTRDVKTLMSVISTERNLKAHMPQIAKLIPSYVKDPSKVPDFVFKDKEEKLILGEVKKRLSAEFCCGSTVVPESKAKHGKAKQAMPGKPAIVFE